MVFNNMNIYKIEWDANGTIPSKKQKEANKEYKTLPEFILALSFRDAFQTIIQTNPKYWIPQNVRLYVSDSALLVSKELSLTDFFVNTKKD